MNTSQTASKEGESSTNLLELLDRARAALAEKQEAITIKIVWDEASVKMLVTQFASAIKDIGEQCDKQNNDAPEKIEGKIACLFDKLTLVREKADRIQKMEEPDPYDKKSLIEYGFEEKELSQKIEGLKKYGKYYSEY